jgi:hypothetical protein
MAAMARVQLRTCRPCAETDHRVLAAASSQTTTTDAPAGETDHRVLAAASSQTTVADAPAGAARRAGTSACARDRNDSARPTAHYPSNHKQRTKTK